MRLYWDNGKENGNYRDYTGIDEDLGILRELLHHLRLEKCRARHSDSAG